MPQLFRRSLHTWRCYPDAAGSGAATPDLVCAVRSAPRAKAGEGSCGVGCGGEVSSVADKPHRCLVFGMATELFRIPLLRRESPRILGPAPALARGSPCQIQCCARNSGTESTGSPRPEISVAPVTLEPSRRGPLDLNRCCARNSATESSRGPRLVVALS